MIIGSEETRLTRSHFSGFSYTFYRPQRSCGQGNIFTPVCHSVHRGGLPQCMLGYQPPWDQTPPGPGRPPPRPGRPPPRPGRPHSGPGRHPPGPDLPSWTRQTPPDQADPPRDQADSSIRSTSGRYASYWNAFLLVVNSLKLMQMTVDMFLPV